ncbi:hypothetical protein PLICRDRAFT_43766 [Plicaturopsis crispa FD-325 SS-3]|nr:hypothetical protein PLICRDRAFT_43766 [Plicaturopsis crispa FD-325 SS-3]
MHHCLQIGEILSQVCSALLDGDGAAGLKSLARLARTCHTFSDPALDILWHTLPSLDPLIRTLPSDLWRIHYPGTTHDSRGDNIGYEAFVRLTRCLPSEQAIAAYLCII